MNQPAEPHDRISWSDAQRVGRWAAVSGVLSLLLAAACGWGLHVLWLLYLAQVTP